MGFVRDSSEQAVDGIHYVMDEEIFDVAIDFKGGLPYILLSGSAEISLIVIVVHIRHDNDEFSYQPAGPETVGFMQEMAFPYP